MDLFLKGVYAFHTGEKTYKVADYISQDNITVYEVYSTSVEAEFDGLKQLSTYYNDSMSGYNNEINANGEESKS